MSKRLAAYAGIAVVLSAPILLAVGRKQPLEANLQIRVTFDRVLEEFLINATAAAHACPGSMQQDFGQMVEVIDKQRVDDETLLLTAFPRSARSLPYVRPKAVEAPAPNDKTAFVLMVFEAAGIYTSTAATEERAFQDLVEYVRKKWQGDYLNVPLPATNEEIVDKYFEMRGQPEGYEILEQEILR